MKILKTYLLLTGLLLTSCFFSCVKDIDLDQTDEVVLTPVFEADFIYSQFNIQDYIPENLPPDIFIQIEPIRDTLNYDLVGTDFAIENLERVILTFEFENTIESQVDFTFQFLNSADATVGQVYTFNVPQGSGPDEEAVNSQWIVELDNSTINTLAAARKLTSEITANNVNSSLEGILNIKSIAAYYINYDL